VLCKESKLRDSILFKESEIEVLVKKLQLTMDTTSAIEVLRNETYLLLKGPKLYQLNILI
jgi:hypothetical protein